MDVEAVYRDPCARRFGILSAEHLDAYRVASAREPLECHRAGAVGAVQVEGALGLAINDHPGQPHVRPFMSEPSHRSCPGCHKRGGVACDAARSVCAADGSLFEDVSPTVVAEGRILVLEGAGARASVVPRGGVATWAIGALTGGSVDAAVVHAYRCADDGRRDVPR